MSRAILTFASPKRAAIGILWGTTERAATQGISFIVTLLLARLLGPADYGLVALAATVALFGQMLLGETFSQALIQQKTLEPEHESSLFWALMVMGVLAGAALMLAAGPAERYFAEPGLASMLRALAPLPLLSALQAVPVALFRRTLDFRALAASAAIGTIAGGALGVGLAYGGFGAWSLVANLLMQSAVTTAAIWQQSAFRPAVMFSRPHFNELWAFARFSVLTRIAAFAANQGPRLLVGFVFGTAALGAFSLGLRIVEMLYQLLAMPTVNVTTTLVARLREDPDALRRTLLSTTQFSALVAAPVYVGLAAIAPAVIPLVFGPRWGASIPIVQLLCLYGLVGACGLIWSAILVGLGRSDIVLATTSTAAVLNLAVLFAGIPFGLIAAAAAFVVRGYLTLPFMPVVIGRLTNIPPSVQYRALAPIMLAALAMFVAVEAAAFQIADALSPPLWIALAIALGAGVYGLVLFLLARPVLRRGLAILGRLRDGAAEDDA